MNILSTFVDTLTREETARHIFGAESEQVAHEAILYNDGGVVSLSEEPLYQIVVLVCLVFYLIWIYRYIAKHGFKAFVGAASAIKENHNSGVHMSSRFRMGDYVLQWSLILGIYILFITKVLEVAEGVAFSHFESFVDRAVPVTRLISEVGLNLWMGVILIGFFGSMVWSISTLYLADLLARRRSVFGEILQLKSRMLLYSVIYLMPCILLCAFGAYDSLRFYLALFMVIIFSLTYLIRSFLLFQSKKISILLWFLYLCAVEIFPITLVWSIFTRS